METEYINRVGLLILDGGKVLIARSRGKDTWYIPGGKIEPGESKLDALKRETMEELHCQIQDIEKYKDFEAHAHGKPEHVILKMSCYFAIPVGEVRASSEIEEINYATYAEKTLLPEMGQLVLDSLKADGLIR